MQVRTGRMPSLTDIADHFTPADRLADSNAVSNFRKMSIAGNISVVMAYLHHPAITAPTARKRDLPMSNCNHRCAGRGGIIDCLVRAYRAKDRMPPIDPER